MKLIQTFFIGFAASTLLCVLVAYILSLEKNQFPDLPLNVNTI